MQWNDIKTSLYNLDNARAKAVFPIPASPSNNRGLSKFIAMCMLIASSSEAI